ncbi:MAG: tetratricopeptide repeat protein [Deltaproteobacteria bacterium]|nr:tetratricopeptide repeat protein [Deltaproteobacteria bacterium]
MSKQRAGNTSVKATGHHRHTASPARGIPFRVLGTTLVLVGGVWALSACGPPPATGPGPSLVADPAPTEDGLPPGAGTGDLDRGVAYVKKQAWTEAIPHLEKAIAAKPDSSEAEYYRALAYDNLKERDKAEKGYARALELDDKLINARLNLAALYLEEPARPKEAIELLKPAVEQEPEAADIRVTLAFAYRLAEDFAKSAEQYGEALKLKDDFKTRYDYADMLFAAGKRPEAAEQMRRLLPQIEKDLEMVAWAAHRFAKCKAYADCVKAFDMAVKLNDKEPGFYLHRGLCKHGLKDEKAARADYAKATKADPKFAPAYYYLGASYLSDNKRQMASKAFQRAAKLGKGTPVGDKAAAKLKKMKGR